MKEHIYILSNRSMPGLLKIGMTTRDPKQRIAELNTTGVPKPFEAEFVAVVDNAQMAERLLHRRLAKHRFDKGREFFKIDVKSAIAVALESLKPLEVVWELTKKTHNLPELVQESERLAREAKLKEDGQRARKITEVTLKLEPMQIRQSEIERSLQLLGPRPNPKKVSSYWISSLWFLFLLPSFMIFSKSDQNLGFVCLALAGVGYLLSRDEQGQRLQNQQLLEPWTKLERELVSARAEVLRLVAEKQRAEQWTPWLPKAEWERRRRQAWSKRR